MGENLISFYKHRVPKQWRVAFFTAFVGCMFIHIYKFVNFLPNHDSFFSVYIDQNMTISGRWFLQYACGISSFFDLPWFNGFLCAVYLSITASAIAELFELKNPVVIGLTSLVLVACPSTTETLFFGFTADGYFLGMMLSAVAACVSSKASKWTHYVVSGICLCLSCAIYQAYISFAIVLCICFLVDRLMDHRITVSRAWKWIGIHVLLYALALAAYYILWKVILAISGQTATNYQGINEVGHIEFSTLISGFIASITNLIFLFLEWNILEHPITLYAILNILFLLGLFSIMAVAIYKSRSYKNPGALFLILFAIVASVPFISVWRFLSEGVAYRPMMLHSVVVFYIFSLVLFEKWVRPKYSTIFGLFMAVVIFNFSVMANVSYFYLDKCYEKSYYQGIRMMTTIEEAKEEQGTIDTIAFVGSRHADVNISDSVPGSKIHLLSNNLEADILYDHLHIYNYLCHTYGLDIPGIAISNLSDIEKEEYIQDMNVWPEEGSAKVVDGTLIIKISEIDNIPNTVH